MTRAREKAFVAGIILLTFCPLAALAQTASQLTPPSFAPPLQTNQGEGFSLPGEVSLATPAGSDRLFVNLRGLRLSGERVPEGSATLAALVSLHQRFTGMRVSGAEIFAAARSLEAAFASDGYVLVRVALPPQKLIDGAELQLSVVDGFIERIDVASVPEAVRGRVAAVLAPLQDRHELTLAEIERRLLLAGDTPGVILRSTLAPGTATGATTLVIEAKHQPVTGLVSIDNTLPRSFGTWITGVGLDFNSVARQGERLYFRSSGHLNGGSEGFFRRRPRIRTLAGGLIMPLGVDGLTFNVEATQALTTPDPAGGLLSTDEFKRLSFRLRYAWIRSRVANFSTQVAFDAQDERSSVFFGAAPTPLFLDRLRIVRLSGEGDVLTTWGGTITGTVTGSFGLDAFGARSALNATAILPLSRQGADDRFSKLDATLSYTQAFAEHLAASVNAHAQTSFGRALLRSEQIGIASPTGLSAFDTGSLQGDAGFVVRGELSSPWDLTLPSTTVGAVVAPYAFAAFGATVLRDPTALEPRHTRAHALGAGLRIGGGEVGTLRNASLTLEYGHGVRRDNFPVKNRFTLLAAINF